MSNDNCFFKSQDNLPGLELTSQRLTLEGKSENCPVCQFAAVANSDGGACFGWTALLAHRRQLGCTEARPVWETRSPEHPVSGATAAATLWADRRWLEAS
jgi:hypothetical protein